MKKTVFVGLCLFAAVTLLSAARAVTDYLWEYSSWVSSDAVLSAQNFTPPIDLDDEQLSIFRLGYACGYDSAVGIYSADNDGNIIRASLVDLTADESGEIYILNTETNKFHVPGCSAEKKILPEHRREIHKTFDEVRQMGYSPCGICLKNSR